MIDEEAAHSLRFVRRQIVENDVNLLGAWRAGDDLGQELDEGVTGVGRFWRSGTCFAEPWRDSPRFGRPA